MFPRVAIAVVFLSVTACNARMIVDGKHYDLDGTPREDPKERVKHATEAMRACSDEVLAVERAFDRDTKPAFLAFAASAPPPPATKKSKTKGRPVAPQPPAAPPASIDVSLHAALDATEHCSAVNLAGVRAVWDEQRYISQPETHDLLEAHWQATQMLARAKEIAMTSMALSLAAKKPHAAASVARVIEARGDKLFVDVPFDHNLRREVLLQALEDTASGCGAKDESGKTTCDKILGAVRTVQTAAGAVQDAKEGRIFAMLAKAGEIADGGDTAQRREEARREAVLPLIPETPPLDRASSALAAAKAGDVHHARLRGQTLVASDGAAEVLDALEK